ncbi:MAG: hypothetical protein GEV11_03685 [Streptosporangiales bacterium]|nr:hypothetical protein [Streptosporangiales bacterium]
MTSPSAALSSGPVLAAVLFGVGLLALLAGMFAYTGRWRAWSGSPFIRFTGPALAWYGVAALLLGGAALAPSTGTVWGPVVWGLVGTALVLVVLAFLFVFWMPRFLRPRWLREGVRPRQRRPRPEMPDPWIFPASESVPEDAPKVPYGRLPGAAVLSRELSRRSAPEWRPRLELTGVLHGPLPHPRPDSGPRRGTLLAGPGALVFIQAPEDDAAWGESYHLRVPFREGSLPEVAPASVGDVAILLGRARDGERRPLFFMVAGEALATARALRTALYEH